MTKDEFNNIVNFSIVDIIGEMDGGVALLFNLLINEKESYEIIFWYNKDGKILIQPEEKFLERIKVSNIQEYDKAQDMAFIMYSNIPDPDNLLNEYIKETD